MQIHINEVFYTPLFIKTFIKRLIKYVINKLKN